MHGSDHHDHHHDQLAHHHRRHGQLHQRLAKDGAERPALDRGGRASRLLRLTAAAQLLGIGPQQGKGQQARQQRQERAKPIRSGVDVAAERLGHAPGGADEQWAKDRPDGAGKDDHADHAGATVARPHLSGDIARLLAACVGDAGENGAQAQQEKRRDADGPGNDRKAQRAGQVTCQQRRPPPGAVHQQADGHGHGGATEQRHGAGDAGIFGPTA